MRASIDCAPLCYLFDAAGLSFFAVAGTQKAVEFGLSPVASALLGMLTGIGGGMMRDALLSEIPQVLRSDLYAVAALAGALIVVIGNVLGLSYGVSAVGGGALCFGLRFMAIRYGWHLPVAHLSAQGRAGVDRSNEKNTTREETSVAESDMEPVHNSSCHIVCHAPGFRRKPVMPSENRRWAGHLKMIACPEQHRGARE